MATTAVEAALSVEVRYRETLASDVIVVSLGEVRGSWLIGSAPIRIPPSHKSQRHYPGLFWAATIHGAVVYESLLERDRLWLADFDPAVVGIATQPFQLSGRDGAVLRQHVPDILLRTSDGTYTVVDVKRAEVLHRPEVREQFAWTRRLCQAKGWAYEVWSGADPVFLANVRFLAVGRRSSMLDRGLVDEVARHGRTGRTISQVEQSAAHVGSSEAVRLATMTLLWCGRWTTDLHQPLSGKSVLSCEEAA